MHVVSMIFFMLCAMTMQETSYMRSTFSFFNFKIIQQNPDKSQTESNSILSDLLMSFISLTPDDCALLLKNFKDLESAYKAIAMQDNSKVSLNAEKEVDFHYICIVKSHRNSYLYELNGDCRELLNTEVMLNTHEDVLSAEGLSLVRKYIECESENVNFSLLVLAST